MKKETYVAVWLTREEILALRELAVKLENPMSLDLISRLGSALLQFGSPLFEMEVANLDCEETEGAQAAHSSPKGSLFARP